MVTMRYPGNNEPCTELGDPGGEHHNNTTFIKAQQGGRGVAMRGVREPRPHSQVCPVLIVVSYIFKHFFNQFTIMDNAVYQDVLLERSKHVWFQSF